VVSANETGRTAVVTGGGSGIGEATCHHLARAGHRVAVLDLDAGHAGKVAEQIRASGGTAIAVGADVSDRGDIDRAVDVVRVELGPVGILVTSAAISGFVAFEDITAAEWDRTMAVNLTGTFHSIQAVVGDMVEAGWGRIITISSAAGQTGSPRQGHYSASKGGVIALTKTVALEYAAKGITANSIPPFTVDTPMLRGAADSKLLPKPEVLARMVPAGRLGTGDDVAALCRFLCSDAASYLTGAVIGVNGGAVV
jgi:2-hydroxycyclohexanecarboxyl-CoA dehydrogenase